MGEACAPPQHRRERGNEPSSNGQVIGRGKFDSFNPKTCLIKTTASRTHEEARLQLVVLEMEVHHVPTEDGLHRNVRGELSRGRERR